MARTTTRQKPKLSPVARRRAAKKRAAHVLKITVVDDHGNAEVPAHPQEGLQFDALYRTIAALRLAQAESDLARHVLKEGLSEANLDELDDYEVDDDWDDWDDELDQPPFDEEEIDPDEFVDHGAYGTYRGVHTLQQGFSLDAVFGEGYLSGNCGFSVTMHP